MATDALRAGSAGAMRAERRSEHFFFVGMALLLLLTVLVGFARTYFLAGMFRAPLPNVLIHIHGAVFTSWILLLVAQTSLVTSGRVDLHRKLGLAGFALACLMVVLGVSAASNGLTRAISVADSIDPKTFYAVPLADMLAFGTLVALAYRARFDSPAHKRLILIATISIMDAPTARPPFNVITGSPHLFDIFCWAYLLILVAYDLWSTRKVHRVTLWAGAFVVAVQQLALPIGGTRGWHAFAGWAERVARAIQG